MISRANTQGLIKGISLAKNAPTLTHLFFADDSILFGQATKEEMFQFIKILNDFSKASGQRINQQKSGLVLAKGTKMDLQAELSSILRIPIWNSPGKYLGIPAEWGNSKNQALQWIKERVLSKLQGWKE